MILVVEEVGDDVWFGVYFEGKDMLREGARLTLRFLAWALEWWIVIYWENLIEKQISGRVEMRASALNLLSFSVYEVPTGYVKWVVVCVSIILGEKLGWS